MTAGAVVVGSSTSMRDEAIRAAARAIARSDGVADHTPIGAYKRNATAAFDAIMERLKEPNEAMEMAGFDAVDPTNPYRIDVANNVWQAMLSILNPTKGERKGE